MSLVAVIDLDSYEAWSAGTRHADPNRPLNSALAAAALWMNLTSSIEDRRIATCIEVVKHLCHG